jgi:hypothetical protein
VQKGIEAKFMMQALMRGSAEQRAAFYASGINGGWLTRNEARRFEDLNPLPGLDEIITPMNMQAGAGQKPDDDEQEDDAEDPPAKKDQPEE